MPPPALKRQKRVMILQRCIFMFICFFPRTQPVLNLVGKGESVILSIHVFAVHINQMTFTPNGRRSHLMILMAAIKVISFQTVALIWILSVIYAGRISKEQLINVHQNIHRSAYCEVGRNGHKIHIVQLRVYIHYLYFVFDFFKCTLRKTVNRQK